MFAHAFFPATFYAPGYFPPASQTVETPRTDGGKKLRKSARRLPEDIQREQQMVEDYLASLEVWKRAAQRIERLPARVRKALPPKVDARTFTEEMARAASVEQLRRIAEHSQAVESARAVARAENRRRFLALIVLALDD